MATTAEIAKRYFDALSAHDPDAAVAVWAPGGVDRFVGQQQLTAPDGIREYFSELFAAFPDFALEIVDLTTYRNRGAVRWRARGTFAGPGDFMGFAANGARIEIEGCDVVTVAGDAIQHLDALVSDCLYTLDPQTGIKGAARVPHPAFDLDIEQARASIRRLAELEPSVVWTGHADPITGNVGAQLELAASAPL
jgi:predicted ester cyclase